MKKTNTQERILIVDDIHQNISVVDAVLSLEGYAIDYRSNGKEAIEAVEENQYDLILMDIMMPVMDGLTATKEICSKSPENKIPIIFLTAKVDKESLRKAFEYGGVDYITKPFNTSELLARVKTHLNLKKQQHDLIELNATKNKFFSIISHDLRSPFNSIIGLTETLAEDIDTLDKEEISNLAKSINSTTKDTYFLLDNLLEWSRTQTQQTKVNPVSVFLPDLVADLFELLEGQALMKKINLELKIRNELTVFADHRMIETTFRNLISNAIKFTKAGGKIIIQIEKQGEMALAKVIDNGIGISENDIKKLFDLKVGYKSKGTGNEIGTGLGLLLCKEFVETNGGKIWVESQVGKGSTFSLTIPLDKNSSNF